MIALRRESLFRLLVATTLGAALVTAGCRQREKPRTGESLATAVVRVLVVQPETRPAHEEVVGTVQSKLRAAIEPKVSARIESVLVAPGQAVKTGDLIALLDAREIQARLDQAVAIRDQASRELTRSRALLQQNIIAQAEYDAIQARERVAIGGLHEAEIMLGYTKVIAPFDGIISRKLLDTGDLAAPGKPIAEMEDPRFLRFEADVPEALIGNLRLGAKLLVRVGATVPEIEGTVAELAPVADPASRTFLAKLELPATDNLRSGQFGRVFVPIGETRSIRVPVSALVIRGQLEIVFVVTKQAAQLRLVRTGERTVRDVELLSGISSGESVVIEGASQLRDGQPVTIQP